MQGPEREGESRGRRLQENGKRKSGQNGMRSDGDVDATLFSPISRDG